MLHYGDNSDMNPIFIIPGFSTSSLTMTVGRINRFKNTILETFNPRDKEIVTQVKLLENKSISQLAKKYNLSSERVRQISEDKFLFMFLPPP